MDPERRELLNRLGGELAAVHEDASANAAMLPGVPEKRCRGVILELEQAVARASAVATAMRALMPQDGR